MCLGLGHSFDEDIMATIIAGISAECEQTGASGSPVLSFDDDEL